MYTCKACLIFDKRKEMCKLTEKFFVWHFQHYLRSRTMCTIFLSVLYVSYEDLVISLRKKRFEDFMYNRQTNEGIIPEKNGIQGLSSLA